MRGLLFLALFLHAPNDAFAQLLQTDQMTDYYGNWYHSITTNAPLGQTFTPTQSQVGFVHLYVQDGGPARLRVNLLAGGISGPIIAASRSAALPQTTAGLQRLVH